MPTNEEVLIRFNAVDKISKTVKGINSSIQDMGVTGAKSWNQLNSAQQQALINASSNMGQMSRGIARFKTTFSNMISPVRTGFKNLREGITQSINNLRKLHQTSENTAKGMGVLKNALGMTVGMLGYDLVNSVMETTRASLNARYSMNAFASRLNMSSSDVEKFQGSLDSLQNTFSKIDMDVVGQQATDMAYRLGLPKESLTDLTETTAIFMDAMQRNGRSAEDSMMAMSDAMDGQFVRLKEIGIGQDELKKNGWDGDIENKTALLKAMNKSLKDQHYDDLAKSVDTLDDAWKVLSISGSNLLEKILLPLTPVIVKIVEGITKFVDSLKNIPSEAIILGIGVAFGILAFVIQTSLIPSILGTVFAMGGLVSEFIALSIFGAPLWAIVLAIIGIGLAIYEVGKYFGWWSDFGTMLDAIKSGVMRLWDAFINSPQVQGVLKDIGGLLDWLGSVLSSIISAVMDFFNIPQQNSKGWTDPIGDIINIFKILGGVCGDVVNWIKKIPQAFMNLLNILNIGSKVSEQVGKNMLDGFAKWLGQIPQKVRHFFGKVAQIIVNIGASARSSALNLGMGIFNSFKNGVGKITSWFSTELGNLPKAIGGAISGCANAIGNLGSSMWDAFKSALGIASPSMIYKRIMWDLEDMPNMIDKNRGGIVNSINTLGTSMITGYNQGLSSSKINGLSSYGVSSTGAYGGVSNTNNTATNIIINEGAIQLDARNLTTKESKAIMINALEGLDSIESVIPNGE